MIASMRTILLSLGFSLALVIAVTFVASAETATAADSTPTVNDAEFARFVERSTAAPKSNPATRLPAAKQMAQQPASCNATQQSIKTRDTLERLELDIARMRSLQEAKWAAKGWTRKEAAEAGEDVVLNGSGYNIKSTVGP